MKRAFLFVCFMTMLGIPAVVLSASARDQPKKAFAQSNVDQAQDKDKDKDKDKSVPAPPTLLLVGVAAAVAGAGKFWLTRSRV